MAPHALRQDPRPNPDVSAGVAKPHPASCSQGFRPTGVDLHQTVVVGAVAVPADSRRVHAELVLGDAQRRSGDTPYSFPASSKQKADAVVGSSMVRMINAKSFMVTTFLFLRIFPSYY
jgi:hypothetical protein